MLFFSAVSTTNGIPFTSVVLVRKQKSDRYGKAWAKPLHSYITTKNVSFFCSKGETSFDFSVLYLLYSGVYSVFGLNNVCSVVEMCD